jgi:hypothetical protein
MALWDKVKEGIDKAGKAAQGAVEEGKLRIDAYRAREQADKAAEALGYAIYRAIESGRELETEARDRLVTALRSRENEAKRLESEVAAAKAGASTGDAATPGAAGAAQNTTTSSAETGPQAS